MRAGSYYDKSWLKCDALGYRARPTRYNKIGAALTQPNSKINIV